MLSIIGSLIGFGTSFLPSVLSFFERGQKNKHELLMLEARAKYANTLSKLKIQELDAEAYIQETRSLYEHDSKLAQANQSKFISALQSSVRPVITYFFFGLFATIKITALIVAVQGGEDVSTAIMSSWDQDTDSVLFATVISFWFGGRMLQKWKGQK